MAKASLTPHYVYINATIVPKIGHESGAIEAIPRDFRPLPKKNISFFPIHNIFETEHRPTIHDGQTPRSRRKRVLTPCLHDRYLKAP